MRGTLCIASFWRISGLGDEAEAEVLVPTFFCLDSGGGRVWDVDSGGQGFVGYEDYLMVCDGASEGWEVCGEVEYSLRDWDLFLSLGSYEYAAGSRLWLKLGSVWIFPVGY